MSSMDNTALFDGTHSDYREVLDTPHITVKNNLVQMHPTHGQKQIPALCIAAGLHSFFEVEWEDIPRIAHTGPTIDAFRLERTGVYYCSLGTDEHELFLFHDAQRGRSCALTEDNHAFTVHALFPMQARSMLGELYNLPSGVAEDAVREAIHLAYNAMMNITVDSLWLRTDLFFKEDRTGEDEAVRRVLCGECSVLEAVSAMCFGVEHLKVFGSSRRFRMPWTMADLIVRPPLN